MENTLYRFVPIADVKKLEDDTYYYCMVKVGSTKYNADLQYHEERDDFSDIAGIDYPMEEIIAVLLPVDLIGKFLNDNL